MKQLVKRKYLLVLTVFLFQCGHEEQIKEISENPNEIKANSTQNTPLIKTNPVNTNKESFNLQDLYYSAISKTERIAIKKEAIVQAEAKRDSFFASFFPSLAFRYQQFITVPNHAA